MHKHAYELSLIAIQAAKVGRFGEFHRTAMAQTISSQETIQDYLRKNAPGLARLAKSDLREDRTIRKEIDTIRHLPITAKPTFFAFKKDGQSAVLHSASDLDRFFGS